MFFWENQTTPNLWTYRFIKFIATTFSLNALIEQCSADQHFLSEAKIAEIGNIVSKIIESVYQDDPYKNALIDSFRQSGSTAKNQSHYWTGKNSNVQNI